MCETKPTVSVIMPAYNAEQTIERQLDAILAQSFADFELIVSDDGSVDQTWQIIQSYAAKDHRIIGIHNQHKGVSAARNSALDIAKGIYVTFADADDWMDTEWLQTFMDHIGDFDCCDQSFKEILPNGEVEIKGYGNCTLMEEEEITTYIYHLCGNLYRYLLKKDIIEKYSLRFKEDLAFREDEIFYLEYVSYSKSISCVTGNHYNYYIPEYVAKYKCYILNFLPYKVELLHRKFANKFDLDRATMESLRSCLSVDLLHKRESNQLLIQTFERFRGNFEDTLPQKWSNSCLLLALKGNYFMRLLFQLYHSVWKLKQRMIVFRI